MTTNVALPERERSQHTKLPEVEHCDEGPGWSVGRLPGAADRQSRQSCADVVPGGGRGRQDLQIEGPRGAHLEARDTAGDVALR